MITRKTFNLLLSINCATVIGLILIFLLVLMPERDARAVEFADLDIEAIEEESEELEEVSDDYLNNRIEQLNEELNKLENIKNTKLWYLGHKKINREFADIASWDEIYDVYSEEDIAWLQRTVETECHGGDFESKANVCRVILNRVEDDKFPNTIKGVVTQSGQFTYHKTKITDDTILACEYAFAFLTPAEGCLWFHSNPKTDTFNGGIYIFTDDIGHHFYGRELIVK